MQSVSDRDVFHHKSKRTDVIRRRQHIVVAEIDLVLAGRDLVMRGLDVKAHRFERQHDLAAHVLALVHRTQIEIARAVVRLGRRHAVFRLEEKELGFGPRVHREALRRGHADHLLETRARIADERLAVRCVDVADHPRDFFAGRARPRKDAKRRQVRPQVHVGFFDADEALDRRAVEHDLSVERVLELTIGDLDVLDRPEDVRELKAHELHFLALSSFENLRFRFSAGRCVRLRHWRILRR